LEGKKGKGPRRAGIKHPMCLSFILKKYILRDGQQFFEKIVSNTLHVVMGKIWGKKRGKRPRRAGLKHPMCLRFIFLKIS